MINSKEQLQLTSDKDQNQILIGKSKEDAALKERLLTQN